MAISTPTNVAAVTGGSVSNASTYDTAVTVLTAGRLYRLTVCNYKASTPAIPTTVTHNPVGTPLSFTLVTAGGQDASVVSFDSAAHRSLSVWEVVPGSTTASALIRITGMGSCSSCGWSLTEITSGFNPTTPTAQVKVASGLQTAAIAVTMGAFADTGNLTTLVMGWGDGTANPAETIVATEGRTELEEHNDGERSSLGSDYQNPNGGDTTIGATLSASTVDWACIGIETAVVVTNVTVLPGVGVGTFTGLAPAVALSNNQNVTPGLGVLTCTGLAPTVVLGTQVLAGLGAATFTGFALVVGVRVTSPLYVGSAPDIGAFEFNAFLPDVGVATWTGLAPTVSAAANVSILPGVGTVTVTGVAPTVAATANKEVLAGFGAGTFTGLAPSVTATANVTATPGLGLGTFTGLAPAAAIGINVQPSFGVTTFTGLAPTVSAPANVNVTPSLGTATWTGLAPTVVIGINCQPGVGVGTFSGLAPAVTATANQSVNPGLGVVVLAGLGPSVFASNNIGLAPGLGAATWTGLAPSVSIAAQGTADPGTGQLVLVGLAPAVLVTVPAPPKHDPIAAHLAHYWLWRNRLD